MLFYQKCGYGCEVRPLQMGCAHLDLDVGGAYVQPKKRSQLTPWIILTLMLSYRLENKLHYNPKVGIMGQNQEDLKKLRIEPVVSISSCQRNLMKTYHNEANTSGITKIASKIFLEFFEQSS